MWLLLLLLWKGQSHNSFLQSPSLNSCFRTQFCYLHLPLCICFSSSSLHVSYRYSIHKNTKYTEQADSCDQPQFVSVYEHLLLPSISKSIYINVGWINSLKLGSTIWKNKKPKKQTNNKSSWNLFLFYKKGLVSHLMQDNNSLHIMCPVSAWQSLEVS